MKKTIRTKTAAIIAIALAFSSVNAFAQSDHMGGGGDIITCLENGAVKSYLLDLYESKTKNRYPNLGEGNIYEKIVFAKARFAELDPVRAEQYALEANQMAEDIDDLIAGKLARNHLVMFNSTLKDIDDADEPVIFKQANEKPAIGQCSKAQLVRQERPILPTDPRYTIDPSLWSLLDTDQKVATLYHEAIYKEFREKGTFNSKATRSLNAKIMTGEIAGISSGDYLDFIKTEKLETYFLGGLFQVLGKKVNVDAQKQIISMESPPESILIGNLSLMVSNPKFKNNEWISARVENKFSLNPERTQVSSIAQESVGLSGGTIEMLADRTLSIQGLSKPNDGGVISIHTDLTGKVIDIQETGYYNNPLSPEVSNLLEELTACVKQTIQKQRGGETAISNLEDLLSRARTAVGAEKDAELARLVADCQSQYASYPKMKVKKEVLKSKVTASAEIASYLNSLIDPSMKECEGYQMHASAGALITINIGIRTVKCSWSDGTRAHYAGIGGGLGFGGAITIEAGKVNLKFPGFDSIGKRISFMGESAVNLTPLIYLPTMKKMREESSAVKVDEEIAYPQSVAIGLAYSRDLNIHVMPKVRNLKPDYSTLIHVLTSQIMVQK